MKPTRLSVPDAHRMVTDANARLMLLALAWARIETRRAEQMRLIQEQEAAR